MQAVILCGGLAARLYPITKSIPKSMIDIGGKPFIYHQLNLLKSKGINDVILSIGNLGEYIEKYVGFGEKWGINVKYSYEKSNNLLGTGGAIKNASDILEDDFMILYGDSYLNVNYNDIIKKFHEENNTMLITVYKNPFEYHKNNIIYKNGKIITYNKDITSDKMKHIDYGITISKKYVFKHYYKNKFDLSEVMKKLIRIDDVSTYEVDEPFYEIGSFEGINKIKQLTLNI